MEKKEKPTVLCASSAYEAKYYFNDRFAALPPAVQSELRILCTLFTEEVGGTFAISFENDGSVILETASAEDDFYYDEVSSALMIGAVRKKRQQLFAQLELFYRMFILEVPHAPSY